MKEAHRGNDLELELIDSPINISENDFEFLIEEVIENALKFSNFGTKIVIKSSLNENMYKLDVTDHGRGMTKEQITNIFPFCQHERNKFQQTGNGLGLISVKNLLSIYGGSLKLFSEINQYTTCGLSLPIFYSI